MSDGCSPPSLPHRLLSDRCCYGCCRTAVSGAAAAARRQHCLTPAAVAAAAASAAAATALVGAPRLWSPLAGGVAAAAALAECFRVLLITVGYHYLRQYIVVLFASPHRVAGDVLTMK
jgi:hypothetical protein